MAAVNALPANCGPRVSSSTVTGFRDFPSDTGLAFRVEGDDAPAGRIDGHGGDLLRPQEGSAYGRAGQCKWVMSGSGRPVGETEFSSAPLQTEDIGTA